MCVCFQCWERRGLVSPPRPTRRPPCCSDKPFGVTADLSLVCGPSPSSPLSSSSNSHQQTFVFLLSSEITFQPLPSVSPCLFSSPCAQPATGMYLEERLARPTGSNKFKAALEPGCLSLPASISSPPLPLLRVLLRVFLLSPRPFRSPFFPPCCSCKPFCLLLLFSSSSAPPPSPFSLVFLLYSSGTRETQRDLLNAFACRSWTSAEGIMWICCVCACVCVNFHIFQPLRPQLHRRRCSSTQRWPRMRVFASVRALPCPSLTRPALLIGL